jgi:hypothetical protein
VGLQQGYGVGCEELRREKPVQLGRDERLLVLREELAKFGF